MEEKVDKAMENVLAMVRSNVRADEALKFTQAALNLAHVKGVLTATALDRKRTKGAGS